MTSVFYSGVILCDEKLDISAVVFTPEAKKSACENQKY